MMPSGADPAAVIPSMVDQMRRTDSSPHLSIIGEGSLPSVFAVTELATASIAAAGAAVSSLVSLTTGSRPAVTVDRRLASAWFSSSLRPVGWSVPPSWDPLAGDYQAADGWIRLHTNAPEHKRAALAALGVVPERERVAQAVARWQAAELEQAVIDAGGCAATMQTAQEWGSSEQGRAVAQELLIAWQETGRAARSWQPDATRPLQGVRVLDMTRVLAGPVATRLLAMLGANVLRIDPPWWDEPGLVPEVLWGKHTARLDLREPHTRQKVLELLTSADVLVHGYRPGALDGLGLGLGAEARRDAAPGLIEVSLDAYGWSGPWAGRRGFDSLVQMSTGIADAGMRLGDADRPTPLPVQALDHATGYLMAAAAIEALTERQRSGRVHSAQLSLARTAHLLTSIGPQPFGEPMRDLGKQDIAAEVERTSWGPARRLRSPLTIDGVDIHADVPARALGSDPASW
ncbi:CoA transferase [Demequina sp. B12]|uniref:CoA transferase n=1 Tax=Demequina sp. B12 TaxID=2992757 RepID=UPI00237C062D|nr:CoA transferase [Demequina sp. B12]MDE0573119.1 CoA transferase [Demequina sp. B12]